MTLHRKNSAAQRLLPIPAILAASVISMTALPAAAEEGPIVLGRQARPSVLSLDPFSGSVNLSSLMEFDSTKTGGSSTTSRTSVISESLSLATGGGIVSRNFFNWSASGTFGLEEDYAQSPARNESSSGILQAYNFNANFLNSTEFPSSYHARRTETYVSRSFQPVVKDIVTDYGAILNYRSSTIPSSLNIFHTETQQLELGGSTPLYTLSEDHVQLTSAYDPNDHHHLDLTYEFVAVGQSNPGSLLTDYQTQNLAVSHEWHFDAAGRYTLNQSLNINSQTGQFSFDHLHLNEQLRLRHTDYFETDYNYNFDEQNYLTSSTMSHQVTAGFSHHLFESLNTVGQVGVTTSSSSFDATPSSQAGSFDTNSYFANLGFSYSKIIPYGTLSADLSLGFNQTDNGAVGSVQNVFNEAHIFTDPQPIILTRPNIDRNSIVIFNATGPHQFIPYVLNTDYVVHQVGNTVQLQLPPVGSNINPGDNVLLDYNVDPLPAYALATSSFHTGGRYDLNEGFLKGVGFYLRYFQQDQTVSPPSALVLPDNITDITLGTDYRVWKFTFNGEYENHDSSLSPYDAMRFSARYADRISQRTNLTLTANQYFINYPQVGNSGSSAANSTALTTIDGHLEYQISRELKAVVTTRWRNNMDQRFGNTMGFEEQGELRWTIRQTQIFFILRHTAVEASSSQSQSILAQFGIIRNF